MPDHEQFLRFLLETAPPGRFKAGDAPYETSNYTDHIYHAAQLEITAPGDRLLGPFLLVHNIYLLILFSIIGGAVCAEKGEPPYQRLLPAFRKSTNIILSDFGCVSFILTI